MLRAENMMLLTLVVLAAAPPKGGAALITADALRGHTRFLASDALEGRGPASAGDRLAQQYISAQFEIMGLSPGAPDGGWLQPVEMVSVLGHPDALRVDRSDGGTGVTLKFHDDFIGTSGHQEKDAKLTKAELVFVGYGIIAPEFRWDDFKGFDAKGKVLVVMNNDPENDPGLFAGSTRLWYGRWDYKYEQAAKLGAAGCIIIHTTPSAGYPWQVVQTSWTGEQFDLPSVGGPSMQFKGWTTEDAMRGVMQLTGHDLDALRSAAQRRDFVPVPLGLTVSTSFSSKVARKVSANVLGVLPGTDARLKSEWLVITAHHDHLGVNADAKPGEDRIYNGAVDNAAGVAAMLTVARALTGAKGPKRSVLFAAVAAEEQGLLGSQYLVAHAPVPTSKMAANINIDGFNIWGRTKDVSVIGYGKSSIDAVLASLAKGQGRSLKADAMPDRGFFYRSDQFNFAKVGVPAAYFASGEEFIGKPEGWGKTQTEKWEATHYHQPSDEISPEWDLAGAVEDAQLVYELTLRLGDAPEMPTWVKGDEFESTRLKSLGQR